MGGQDRVLVTGAGGFIGSHLAVELASAGARVRALDVDLARLRHLEGARNLDLVEGDFTVPEVQRFALQSGGTVFHLAAAHLGVSTGAEEFWRVNVDGLERFAAGARRAGVRRFVHCSSVGVYGRVEDPPADEDTPCRPELDYERSKLEGERVVLEAARRGLPAVVLRPVWVYGPGCPRTEKLFRAVGRGRFVVAGGGRNLRHSIYVRDMVRALRLAAGAPRAVGEILVVGDAGAVTVRRLVDEIARLTGVRPPRSVPLPLLRLVALGAEAVFRPIGREPPLSRRTLRFFTGNTSFDVGKARRLLGFEPRYDLRSGLRETYDLIRHRPWRPSLGGEPDPGAESADGAPSP